MSVRRSARAPKVKKLDNDFVSEEQEEKVEKTRKILIKRSDGAQNATIVLRQSNGEDARDLEDDDLDGSQTVDVERDDDDEEEDADIDAEDEYDDGEEDFTDKKKPKGGNKKTTSSSTPKTNKRGRPKTGAKTTPKPTNIGPVVKPTSRQVSTPKKPQPNQVGIKTPRASLFTNAVPPAVPVPSPASSASASPAGSGNLKLKLKLSRPVVGKDPVSPSGTVKSESSGSQSPSASLGSAKKGAIAQSPSTGSQAGRKSKLSSSSSTGSKKKNTDMSDDEEDDSFDSFGESDEESVVNDAEEYDDEEDDDELQYLREPNRKLTSRQRSSLRKTESEVSVPLYEDPEFLSLPMKTKKKTALDAEEENWKKNEAARKRKIQAMQLLEAEKRAVVKKLLVSSTSSKSKARAASSSSSQIAQNDEDDEEKEDFDEDPSDDKSTLSATPLFVVQPLNSGHRNYETRFTPMIRTVIRGSGPEEPVLCSEVAKTLSAEKQDTPSSRFTYYPDCDLFQFDFAPKAVVPPPSSALCSVCSCNPKKYSCAKTSTPLCSLSCYKKHQATYSS